MATETQIQEATKKIVESCHPEKIILFGSYAKGNSQNDSDVDLLVVKDSDLPRYKRGKEIRRCLRGLKVPFDILVYTRDEIAKWRSVKTAFITVAMETGRVLYGK